MQETGYIKTETSGACGLFPQYLPIILGTIDGRDQWRGRDQTVPCGTTGEDPNMVEVGYVEDIIGLEAVRVDNAVRSYFAFNDREKRF